MSPELFYPDCKVHGRNSVMLEDPDDEDEEDVDNLSERDALNPAAAAVAAAPNGGGGGGGRSPLGYPGSPGPPPPPIAAPPYDHSNCSDQLHKSCACVNFIAEHTKAREEATKVRNIHWIPSPRCPPFYAVMHGQLQPATG